MNFDCCRPEFNNLPIHLSIYWWRTWRNFNSFSPYAPLSSTGIQVHVLPGILLENKHVGYYGSMTDNLYILSCILVCLNLYAFAKRGYQ